MRKIIVTSALPYANGPIHLGHMVEFIQTDIWKRFQQLMGNECLYIWGSDAHGTPIMLRAEKEGLTPEQLVTRIHQEHSRDFDDFYISYDNFYTTHSPENNELACDIYRRLRDRGDIEIKTIIQAFDPIKHIFLPDRFVKGDCPRCHAKDQYGDNCEQCGATYTPMELKNPRSVLSGTTPIEKESEHYFFKLPRHEPFLREWTKEHIPATVANKLDEWFFSGLQNWDISRDAPYFGFQIPDTPANNQAKYFYVWLDAPIGYMASFKNLCARRPDLNFAEYWDADSKTELHHFIGKDIMYFHALFWPAVLNGSGYRTPTAIHTHGFLTINGQKMSKSRGTFVKARTYLQHLDPEYLRYYFATKLSDSIEDIDLNFEDFRLRINSDLIGKYINIASRCAGFITKNFAGQLSAKLIDPELFSSFVAQASSIANHYENRDYSRTMREIMLLADKANQYIADKAPWILAKNPDTLSQVQDICSLGLNLFRVLTIYLQPVLPKLTEKVEQFFNVQPFTWNDHAQPLLAHTINQFVPLMARIEEPQIAALIAATQAETI